MADLDLSNYLGTLTMAVGALGTAAFALVDTSKALFPSGGMSNTGFAAIRTAYHGLFGKNAVVGPLEYDLATLHGNWINGRSLADQQAIAKSLVKLRLNGSTASALAAATGVDAKILQTVGEKMSAGKALEDGESNVLGRFDLALTSILDGAYQLADQRYRNWSRVCAMFVAIIMAVIGGLTIDHGDRIGLYILAGVLATPIAPISKDLTSALAAGVKVAQSIKR